MSEKAKSVTILVLAQVTALSLWFVSSAILPEMLKETVISAERQAALASAVSAGFVIGALLSAILGIADRFDPRRVFAVCVMMSALASLGLLIFEPGDALSILSRFVTGAMLAGVYPVGMKIAVGWGREDRGLLVGLLVGALTLGSAAPHLVSWFGGADWRNVIILVSGLAAFSGLLILLIKLGPHHANSSAFEAKAIGEAWTNRRVRYAYLGYFGHMWELYAMWAWIGAIAFTSFSVSISNDDALSLSKLVAFLAIAAGGAGCVLGGYVADRVGKARVTIIAMSVSGLAAVATAASFGGPVWITVICIIIWGLAIIPDSPQFSALVADASPPEIAGSLMTLQTAIGFALTIFTVQAAPLLANIIGWSAVIILMALGPLFGIWFMRKLEALG